jgi:hypothetical protein
VHEEVVLVLDGRLRIEGDAFGEVCPGVSVPAKLDEDVSVGELLRCTGRGEEATGRRFVLA